MVCINQYNPCPYITILYHFILIHYSHITTYYFYISGICHKHIVPHYEFPDDTLHACALDLIIDFLCGLLAKLLVISLYYYLIYQGFCLYVYSLNNPISKPQKWNIQHLRNYNSMVSFLGAKASKGMHQDFIEKSSDRHLSIHLRRKKFLWVYEYTPWVL